MGVATFLNSSRNFFVVESLAAAFGFSEEQFLPVAAASLNPSCVRAKVLHLRGPSSLT